MNKRFGMVLGGLVFTAVTQMASATVTKYVQDYVGNRCVEYSDSTPDIEYYGSAAENGAGTSQDFYCPVTFEHETTIDGYVMTADALTWSAYVDDDHASENVSCFLRICTLDAASCETTGSVSSSGTGVQLLTGGSLSTLAGDSYFVPYLRCTIPAVSSGNESGIVSYRITTDGVD